MKGTEDGRTQEREIYAFIGQLLARVGEPKIDGQPLTLADVEQFTLDAYGPIAEPMLDEVVITRH